MQRHICTNSLTFGKILNHPESECRSVKKSQAKNGQAAAQKSECLSSKHSKNKGQMSVVGSNAVNGSVTSVEDCSGHAVFNLQTSRRVTSRSKVKFFQLDVFLQFRLQYC